MTGTDELAELLNAPGVARLDRVLLVLAAADDKPVRVTEAKQIGRRAGCVEIMRWNISDVLRRSKGLAINLPEGWMLSTLGRDRVAALRAKLGQHRPRTVHLAPDLRSLVARISDAHTSAFLEEAIACFEYKLYRSAVVLSWVGAVSLLQEQVMQHHLAAFNSEASARKIKDWRAAKSKDDLSRMKESEFLDIIGSPPISLIGKNTKEELKDNCLRLRNSCGHPNSFIVGESRTAAHLEVLIQNVYAVFT